MSEIKQRLLPFIKDLNFSEFKMLWQLVDSIVQDAYIAGADGTKGIGLNISKEDRAAEYCHKLGLRP